MYEQAMSLSDKAGIQSVYRFFSIGEKAILSEFLRTGIGKRTQYCTEFIRPFLSCIIKKAQAL